MAIANIAVQPAQLRVSFTDHAVTYSIYFGSGEVRPLAHTSAPLPFEYDEAGRRGTLEAASTHLVEGLDTLFNELTEDERLAFWRMLSDGQRMRKLGWQGFFDYDINVDLLWSPDHLLAIALLYKAVSLFLRSGDRYIQMDAWLIYIFSTWQWYNLVKLALELQLAASEQSDTRRADFTEAISREFASAYSALAPMLTTERFVYALRWMPVWLGRTTAEVPTGPLLRERMRLSMVLARSEGQIKRMPEDFDPRKPVDAPGCFHSGRLRWDQTRLHPMFTDSSEKDAQAEVRRLIANWLLPRYDFESALRLSRMIRTGERQDPAFLRALPHWFWLLEGLLFAWFFLSIVIGSRMIGGRSGFLNIFSNGTIGGRYLVDTSVFELVLFLVPVALFFILLDWHTIQNFALPRVIGGVFIGYLALALQSDSVKFISAFLRWDSIFLMPLIVWLVVLVLGGLYLISDTNALVRNWRTAWKRATQTLVTVLFAAAIIGLLVVAVTTIAFPEREVFSEEGSLYYQIVPLIEAGEKYFLGPFGWVNVFQYLLFVPLALFTGLVTQFIFEEQSVTASVWAAEQE